MIQSTFSRLSSLVLLLFTICSVSWAQNSVLGACRADAQGAKSRLTGVITDPSGASVAGATFDISCGDFHREVIAADDGTYGVTLPQGSYHVAVSAPGFENVSKQVAVTTTEVKFDITLPVGAVTSIVTVTAPAGYVATSATTATKSGATLVETPQTVSVVTLDQMAQRDVQTIGQAVAYTAGVGTSTYGNESRFDYLSIRGFDESTYGLFRDNSRWQTGQISGQIDPYLIQELDVVKGPSSVLYGQNTPGGLINVVTKRPEAETSNELVLNYGSYEHRQVQGDFTGPLDKDGHLRYRLTGLMRNSNTQVSYVPDDRRLIAPAISWTPSANTTLTLLGDYQRDSTGWGQFLPSQGVLTSNPYGRIPTDFFTGEPGYDYFRRQQWSTGVLFEHHFSDRWTIRQTSRFSKIAFHGQDVFGGGLESDMRTLTRYGFGNSLDQDLYTTDTQALTRIRTHSIEHNVLFGVDYSHSDSTIASGFASAPSIDVFSPVYGATIPSLFTYYNTNQPSWQTGVYGQDYMRIARKLIVTLSGREDFTSMTTSNRIATPETVTKQSPDQFTGRAGITYVSDSGFAPYFSYSTSFLPTGGVDFSGNPFRPTTGEQYEAGVKYQPHRSSSFITASFFNLTENNVQTPDADPSHASSFVQTGAVRSRGIELEGVASLFQGFDVHASYSYLDEVVTKTTDVAQLGKRPTLIPDQLFSVTGNYTVSRGPLAGLGIGLGTRFTGTTAGDSANDLMLPTYTLVDASLRYTWRKIQFQLSSTNLLDRIYVPVCTSVSYCNYGGRRNVNASIRYHWNSWTK